LAHAAFLGFGGHSNTISERPTPTVPEFRTLDTSRRFPYEERVVNLSTNATSPLVPGSPFCERMGVDVLHPLFHKTTGANMLHTTRPADYIAADKLAEPSNCPDCGARSVLSVGVIHLAHYRFQGEECQGLVWMCSDKCFLSWEDRKFMGNC
jgi:hypothetical protein